MADAQGIKAGRAYVQVGADDTEARSKLEAFNKRMNDTARDMAKIGAATAGVGAAIIAPLVLATATAIALGDELDKMSLRTGIAVNALSALGYAAEQSGASMDDLETATRKMQQNLTDAANRTGEAIKALRELGISAEAISGMKPDEQLTLLYDAINRVEDPTKRAAIAIDIFGRSGTRLLPLFKDGAAGVEALKQHYRELGLEIDKGTTSKLVEFGDALSDTNKQVDRMKTEIGLAIAQALLPYKDQIAGALAGTIQWLKENHQFIQSAAAFGASLIGVGSTLLTLAAAIRTTTAAVRLFSLAISGGPVLLAAAAVGALYLAYKGLPDAIHAAAEAQKQANVASGAAVSAGDAERAGQLSKLDRLEKLAGKERLTNQEMKTAKSIIADLTGAYGDLGISLDETTGKLSGVAAAQQKVREAMQAARSVELQAQLDAAKEQIKAKEREIKNVAPGWSDIPTMLLSDPAKGQNFSSVESRADQLKRERSLLVDQAAAIQAKLDAFRAINDLSNSALTGGLTPEGGGSPIFDKEQAAANAVKIKEEAEKLRRELDRIERDSARDLMTQNERKIDDIRKMYAERIALAMKLAQFEITTGRFDPEQLGRAVRAIGDAQRDLQEMTRRAVVDAFNGMREHLAKSVGGIFGGAGSKSPDRPDFAAFQQQAFTAAQAALGAGQSNPLPDLMKKNNEQNAMALNQLQEIAKKVGAVVLI